MKEQYLRWEVTVTFEPWVAGWNAVLLSLSLEFSFKYHVI